MNESLAKHFGLSLIHVVGTTEGEVSMACLVNGCGWHRIDAGPLADLVDQAESHINESHMGLGGGGTAYRTIESGSGWIAPNTDPIIINQNKEPNP